MGRVDRRFIANWDPPDSLGSPPCAYCAATGPARDLGTDICCACLWSVSTGETCCCWSLSSRSGSRGSAATSSSMLRWRCCATAVVVATSRRAGGMCRMWRTPSSVVSGLVLLLRHPLLLPPLRPQGLLFRRELLAARCRQCRWIAVAWLAARRSSPLSCGCSRERSAPHSICKKV